MSEVYSIHQSLGYLLSVAARGQERQLESALRRLGLTRTGWYVLLAIGCDGLAHPSEIASFLRIDRTAASRALRQLEEAGIVARQTGKLDRRTTDVWLTARGKQVLNKGIPMTDANTEPQDNRLTPAERAEIRRLLGKLTEGGETPLKHL